MTNAEAIRILDNDQLAELLATFYLKEPGTSNFEEIKELMIKMLEDEFKDVEC